MPTGERVQKERRALELQRAGYTYELIGELLGMTASGAWKLCYRALSRAPAMNVDYHRTVESDRLQRLWRSLYPSARDGDVKAAAVCVKISESLRRLNGWDAPIKVDMHTRSKLDAEIAALVDELAGLPPAPSETDAVH